MSVITDKDYTSADGLWTVLEAGDAPLGLPRTKTAKTVAEAFAKPWDNVAADSLRRVPVGSGRLKDYIKVRSADLSAARAARTPKPGQLRASVDSGLPIPSDFLPKRRIPDYPGKCPACGKGTLVLFSSVEHEDGACQGRKVRDRARG